MNQDNAPQTVPEWEKIRVDPKRTEKFQAFMDSLDEKEVRRAKVKFGQEWGESK